MGETTEVTEVPTLTVERAIELLRRAVAEKTPEYVYPPAADGETCVYVENGAPSCVVGHVVNYINPDLLPKIEWWERNDRELPHDVEYYDEYPVTLETGNIGSSSVSDLSDALLNSGLLKIDPQAEHILRIAQCGQDAGIPWGEAVEDAIQAYERNRSKTTTD